VNLLSEEELAAFLSSGVSTQEYAKFRVNTPRLSQLWDETKQSAILNFEQKKDELLKSLEFAKQQGLKEPRLKILNELIRNYPNDEQVLKILDQEKEFQARQVIARATSKKEMSNDIRLTASPQFIDNDLRSHLLKQALKKIKKNPELSVDITIMFYQMDFYEEAFQIIDTDKTGDARLIWYEIIISIEAEKFVRALSALNRLKNVKLDQADYSFSIMYYHALVLHGMGHKAEALQVLRNIVKIRPQFKSAVTLLSDWENEK
jgi:tetratricopeptide (TPR) repeat protein